VDKYKIKKEQAGIKELSEFSNYYEAMTLVEKTGYDIGKVLNMDDGYATKILLSLTKRANFDERFNEIMKRK